MNLNPKNNPIMNTPKIRQLRPVIAGIALCLVAADSQATQFFFDNFESGLGQWVGKSGGPGDGITVTDPVNAGHGNVLTFTALNNSGDIYTTSTLSPGQGFVLSFDYLGLPNLGGNSNDLGGFIGISANLNPFNLGTDHFWLAGTENNYGVVQVLPGDGAWHHYDLLISGSPLASFHVMIQDYDFSGGVPGDVFFDNVTVSSIPEPRILSLLGGAALVFGRRFLRHKPGC